MFKAVIDRVETGGAGTFGTLKFEHEAPIAVTLERQWLNNQRGVSCIPAGEYICRRCRTSPEYGFKDSPQFGDTFVVTDVEGRQYILFHAGNLEDDTHGCILVGEEYGILAGDPAILSSRKGFNEFMATIANVDEFALSIRNHFI